jgi:thymidylate synthase ThyX
MISVKIIADSIYKEHRITTMQLTYPRFIHSEFMTHRVFSRNASSSRAVPVSKTIAQVKESPAAPVHWGRNQSGMQAREELGNMDKLRAHLVWKEAAQSAVSYAEKLVGLGVHKQIVNRILEPFQLIHVVVTATEWDNFFSLRMHKDAQPEMQTLATLMYHAIEESTPEVLSIGEWHLPYISREEVLAHKARGSFMDAVRCSAARCARVSYIKHDGATPKLEDDLELFSQLVVRPFTDKRGSTLTSKDPIHASPIEHQATPDIQEVGSGNFRGWLQFRKIFELDKSTNKGYNIL